MSRTTKKCTPKEKISRSRRLQKYEVAYEICMKKLHKNSPPKCTKSPRKKPNKSPRKKKESKKSTPRKKSLNIYQTFVQEESKQDKYQGIDSKTRLKLISQAWHNKKKD